MRMLEIRDLSRTVAAKADTVMALKLCRRLSGFIAGANSRCNRLSDVDKFALLFQNCTDVRSLKKLHARVLTLGLGRDVILGSEVLICYASLGVLCKTRLCFQGFLNDDLAQWNSVMVDIFRAGYPEEAILLYRRLKLRQIGLDEKTVTFGLKSCTELRNLLLGKGMHSDSLKLGLSRDKFVGSSLVGLYSKLARMDDSQKAFEEILDKDIVSYTSMITGYSENMDSTSWNVFEIASDMSRSNLEVNRVTLVSLLQVAGNLGAIREGKSVHCYSIRRGIGVSDEILGTSLVHLYMQCGAYQLASVALKNSVQSVASWNAMLAGLVRTGQSGNAIHHFSVMLHEHKAVSELGHLKDIKQIHCFVYRALLEKDTKTINSLITAYAKCGRLDLSVGLFLSLEHRDLDSWNSMISAYGMHGFYTKVLEMFKLMEEGNINPDGLTFSSVLSACSHAGLIKEGLHIFQSMTSIYSVLPQEEHYGCIVDLLSRAGHLEEGYKLIKLSTLNDKSSVLCALLSACRTYGNTMLGQVISNELLELGQQNPGTYALISEVFAQKGQWNKSANIRNRAKENGSRKLPGSSLIESVEQANKVMIPSAFARRL